MKHKWIKIHENILKKTSKKNYKRNNNIYVKVIFIVELEIYI